MVDRSCDFNGDLYLSLTNRCFMLYPVKNRKLFNIIYDLSTDLNNDPRLSLKIKKDMSARANFIISFKDTDKIIFEIHVQAINLESDLMKDDLYNLTKTIEVFGDYKLKICEKSCLVESVYKYPDRSSHTVFTNPGANMYSVNIWLCGIWPPKCLCREYCITTNNSIVERSQTFLECASKGAITIQVAEKCEVFPITEDCGPVEVPWNKKANIMATYVSEILKVDIGALALIDNDKIVFDAENQSCELNIANLRPIDALEVPRLFYDVPSKKMTFSPLRTDQPFLSIIFIIEITLGEIKARLGFKTKVDPSRIIICRGERLLEDNYEIISLNDNLKYCIGLSPNDIISKELIGFGSYAEVYACKRNSSPEIFALKEFILPPGEWKTGSVIREMDVLFTVTETIRRENVGFSINIMQYLDFYIANNKVSIAMEYAAGGSLSQLITQSGPLVEQDIRKYTKDILEGLKFLHKQKIMHRDINGRNVLLDDQLVAKLSDFGISKIVRNYSTRELSDGIHRTGDVGTTRWTAPEVLKGEDYGLKIDTWSVGATVVEMITGHHPYYSIQEEMSVHYKICKMDKFEFDPPVPELSKELQEFIDCSIVVDAKKRFNVFKLLELDFFIVSNYS